MSAEALLMKLKRRVLVRSLKGGLVSPQRMFFVFGVKGAALELLRM